MNNYIDRYPIGCTVTNMGTRAIVTGYYEHMDGSIDLILRQVKPSGKLSRSQFLAPPQACDRA